MLDGNGDNIGDALVHRYRGAGCIRHHAAGAVPGPRYVPRMSQTPMTARTRISNGATVVPRRRWLHSPPGRPRRVWTRGAWLRSNAHPWTPRWAAEMTRAFDEFAVDLRPCPCPRQRGSRQMVCPHRRGQPDRRDRRVGQAVGAQEPPDHPAGQRAWRHRRPWCDQRTEGHSRPGAHVPGVITHYARLVIQVADPGATVALVENSTQRP
jgi:hypothetical protein